MIVSGGSQRRGQARRIRALCALALSLTVGCAARPSPYDLDPRDFEAERDSFGRVGIALGSASGSVEIVAPAKGWWGGLKRGLFAGAMTPIAIGFLTPVPLGTAVGAMFAPYGAVIGGVYGIVVAPPTELVEEAEAGIALAVDRLLSADVREQMVADLAASANERSEFEVTGLGVVSMDADHEPDLSEIPVDEVDTLVLFGPSVAGLAGARTLNPPLTGVFQTRIRVLRLQPEVETVYDYDLRCQDAERSYEEWGATDGAAFEGAIVNCLPLLLEKAVDDLFVLYRPEGGSEP